MKLKRSHIAACHDIIMAALSFILSLYLRLGTERFSVSYPSLIEGTLLFTLICTGVFLSLRFYRGMWRYASVQDLIAITKAVTLALLIFTPTMFLFNRLEGVPRSLIVINWLMLMALLGGPRFLYRIMRDYTPLKNTPKNQRIPVLLAGINHNAELFLRETSCNGTSEYTVVGLLDNDKEKIGRHIYNVRIYGDFTVIPKVVQKLKRRGTPPQKILLTSDYTEPDVAKKLLDVADSLGLSVARLPRLSEFKQGVDEKIQLQPLVLEDLLHRPQNTLNREAMQALVQKKKVLVTGAGGTIGSELVRQIASYNPEHITLVEFSEFNLYQIDKELQEKFPDISHKSRIIDIRDRAALSHVFSETAPDIVFHAAALKHVPLVEDNMTQAVLTNVMGTKNVADCCMAHQIPHMVHISTDKAVNPTNVMGTTKRIAECYIHALGQAAPTKSTLFTIVRFGNVLGSSGSVIPLFQKQLERGGPLTVTHPDIERYFMTVREAVELVLEASSLAANNKSLNGGIFVLDMGSPVKIRELARQMIRLAGLREGIDIQISYTGLRPGEKLTEELFYASENKLDTPYNNIFLTSSPPIDLEILNRTLAELVAFSRKGDITNTLAYLKILVPEYKKSGIAA